MRYIGLLIDEARLSSDNKDFTEDSGLQDSEFLRWANMAQNKIVSLIQQTHPDVFVKTIVFTSVQGQAQYTMPADLYYDSKVSLVEYSHTGNPKDYFPMRKASKRERINGSLGRPDKYIRLNNTVEVQPAPETSAALIRVLYQKRFPKLDTRRAQVSAVTLATDTITSLTFDTAVILDSTKILAEQFVTICDSYGAIKMAAIPITAINTSTGVATIDPSFVFQSGETISVGDYAVVGKLSTTHSDFPDEVERFLVEFMIWKANKRDSSNDSIESNEELMQMAQEIIDTYAEPDDDVTFVPILSGEYTSTYEN